MSTVERCVNCEEPIVGVPVYFDGEAYCCHGCVAGGPCVCTYSDTPASSSTLVDLPAPAVAPARDTREPIPFRRPAPVLVVLRVMGPLDQRDLLLFASTLEQMAGISEVALTRVEAGEAWFAVSAASPEVIAGSLDAMLDFSVAATVVQGAVDAMVVRVAPATPAQETPVTLDETGPCIDETDEKEADGTLLPPRQRFRVFRPQAGAPSAPAAPMAPVRPAEVPAVPSAPPRPAARSIDVTRPVKPPRPALPATPSAPATAVAPAVEPGLMPAPAAPRLGKTSVVREPEVPERVARTAEADVVAPEERPGGAISVAEHLTLIVYPFHSFVALNQFQAAIRALRGVTSTRVRRFYRGTLHLAVDYEDIIPLSERLNDLRAISFRIVQESRQEIELVLEESRSLVAAGEG